MILIIDLDGGELGDGEVKLRFANTYRVKKYLMERTWHQSQHFEELEDGRLMMSFKVQSMNQVWPWIRSFGEEVEVLAPLDAEC